MVQLQKARAPGLLHRCGWAERTSQRCCLPNERRRLRQPRKYWSPMKFIDAPSDAGVERIEAGAGRYGQESMTKKAWHLVPVANHRKVYG